MKKTKKNNKAQKNIALKLEMSLRRLFKLEDELYKTIKQNTYES